LETQGLRRSLSWIFVVLAGCAASLAGERSLHRYKMTLALDQSPESEWLRREMERDWTKPNPEVVLTPEQQREVRIRGAELNAVMARLRQKFVITIVSDCPVGIRKPAINMGSKWESIDRRAFVRETDPLKTLEWYHREHDWVVGRPAGEGDWERYWYSGPQPYPPWVADPGHEIEMYQDGVRRRTTRDAEKDRGL
jgi:hypothetical protein